MIRTVTTQFLRKGRFFSTIIKNVEGNRPPVREESVEGRYAGVLFSIASKNEQLDQVNNDMEFFTQLLKKSSKFSSFVQNTSNTKQELEQVIYTLGGTLTDTTKQFIDSLIDGKRMSDLPSIAKKYVDYYKLLNKEQGVTVISARDLTSEQKSRLQQTLQETYQGTTFTVQYQVDPSILGGLQLYFGDSFLDASLQSRVNTIRNEFERLTM